MQRILCLSFLMIAVVAKSSAAGDDMKGKKADLILKNANLITLEKSTPHDADAIAAQGERILKIGTWKEIAALAGPETQVIDLKGAYVYPGFIDSHVHILGVGSGKSRVDLNGTPTKESVLERVKEAAGKIPDKEWIVGRGWDQNDWPNKEFPTARDLDQGIATPHPVVLERVDGHAYWVNSEALKRAGITKTTPDPDGGKIMKDPDGNPTGILIDTAASLVDQVMENLSIEENERRMKYAFEEALRHGLTGLHDAGASSQDIQVWQQLARKKELPVRIYAAMSADDSQFKMYLSKKPALLDPYITVRALKIWIDGALGSRGAALLAPYSDDPSNSGLIIVKPEELQDILRQAKNAGIQAWVHAIGDRGNKVVLDMYEKTGVKDLRWRIEHVQVLAPADIPRLGKLGIIASMQPTHATSDMPWAPERLGPKRVKGAYVWRSLMNYKTLIAGGSDAPVEDINPLWGIYAAITRQDHEGKPQGGWLPHERVTPEEALRMFTINAAYAAFQEKELGSLKEGKFADMVVLPKNILEGDPKELITMKVLHTIVGGKVRYSQ